MPNDVRTCGQDCDCYDSQTGNCCLYSVLTNPDQIKPFKAKAYDGDSCKYGLAVGEQTPQTPQQFLNLLHHRADPFLVFPSPKAVDFSDIDSRVLEGLSQKVQSQLHVQH